MESARLGFICFICLFLFIFIYFHWFLLISLISSISTYFLCFCYFFRVCRKMIAPPLPKQVGFKNANRTRKLENRIVSFFFSKGVQNRSFHSSGRIFYDSVTKKLHFFDFRNFCNFWKPRVDIFQNFGVRHKDFKAFWSPAQGF